METRKTGSTNDRQDLLAEMLGVMTRLRAAEEPSPADAEPRRDAGSKGPAGEEWLSVQTACDYVHVSRTTMYRLVREGKLPSRRELGPNSNTVNMRVAKRRRELSGEPDPKAGGAELREARKRIREPEAENALPEKAAAFFAEDQARPRAAA